MPDDAEHARQEVDRMLREAVIALAPSPDLAEKIMAIAHDSRLLGIPVGDRGRELMRAMTDAQQFYWDGRGKSHRIRDMPNGYLHNAAAAMRARRLTGVEPFTLVAMDVEIRRREKEQGETHG